MALEKEPKRIESDLRKLADKTPGLSFGYIGNFERWGDDRLLYFADPSGNRLWSHEAHRLDHRALARARWIAGIYAAGFEAGKGGE